DEALVRAMFTESQNRVSAIALIHEQLYQNDNLSEINLQEYIKNLAQSLFTSFGERSAKIRLQVDVVPLMVNIETAMPCGLIINELMSNALKHAFNHTDSGTISVTLTFDDNKLITLTVADDGIGMNNSLNLNQSESEKEDNQKLLSQVNPKLSQLYKSRRSLGFKLIDNLVRQLKAKLTCSMSGGTKFEFQFIELNYYTRI
ncbi:MAG: sensor histidine kinase, partial [Pseudanabaenaceae cyanobacterium]